MKTFKDLSSVAKKEIKDHYADVSQHPHMKMNYNDYEGRLAKQSLYKAHKYSKDLFEMLDDQVELEGWVQDKISKACANLSSVKYYLDYEMENGSEDNPYEEYEYDDEDMIEDIHHINDLIPNYLQECASDVNNDGDIDVLDVIQTVQYIINS